MRTPEEIAQEITNESGEGCAIKAHWYNTPKLEAKIAEAIRAERETYTATIKDLREDLYNTAERQSAAGVAWPTKTEFAEWVWNYTQRWHKPPQPSDIYAYLSSRQLSAEDDVSGIHSCHDKCQRPKCVERRARPNPGGPKERTR